MEAELLEADLLSIAPVETGSEVALADPSAVADVLEVPDVEAMAEVVESEALLPPESASDVPDTIAPFADPALLAPFIIIAEEPGSGISVVEFSHGGGIFGLVPDDINPFLFEIATFLDTELLLRALKAMYEEYKATGEITTEDRDVRKLVTAMLSDSSDLLCPTILPAVCTHVASAAYKACDALEEAERKNCRSLYSLLRDDVCPLSCKILEECERYSEKGNLILLEGPEVEPEIDLGGGFGFEVEP